MASTSEALSDKRKAGKLQGFQVFDHATADADLKESVKEDSCPTPHAAQAYSLPMAVWNQKIGV